MKTILLTTAAMIGALVLPSILMADTRTARAAYSLPDYVEQVGCVLVDKGGYSIVRAADGTSFCEGMKGWNVQAGTQLVSFDPDGTPGTGDEYTERRRDNN